MGTRINYIHENPVRAGWVENPEDYLYSSARNFSEMTGLIEIDGIRVVVANYNQRGITVEILE